MSVPIRLSAFLAGLGLVFGLSFAVGEAIGPDVEPESHDMDAHAEETAYALQLGERQVRAGNDRTITFRVLDAHRRPVTVYDERHERDLHLIVVATDNLRDYQHVHPKLGRNGSWSVDLDLAPGGYRVYADTQPVGAEPMVLEGRLRANGGPVVREPLPAPSVTARVGRYDVTLAGQDGRTMFSVSLHGTPVTDLQPYLGAYGHLVVIRADDLAYLHAHPQDGPAGPDVAFDVEYDGAGSHALYLDFKHRGVVRTAMFTVEAGKPAGHGDEEGHDGH